MTDNLPAVPQGVMSPDIIKQIAMDIGKEVSKHIEIQYPRAVEAAGRNMLLSVRNCTYNEIMAALNHTDEEKIKARLQDRATFRRQQTSFYNRIRKKP